MTTHVWRSKRSAESNTPYLCQSIYPGLLSIKAGLADETQGRILEISIPIALASSTTAVLSAIPSTAGPSTTSPTLDISHLPPLTVRLRLRPTYPLEASPTVISIRAPLPSAERGQAWLSRKSLSGLQDRLASLWKEDVEVSGEGTGVLWRWWEWIANGDFLYDLTMYDKEGRIK
jgi:E3 ubiquitin-protein ligase RNF14